MPLVKATLETQLTQLFDSLATSTDGVNARQLLVSNLATIIDTYVKSALVKVNVVTTGSATTQTGTGTGTLS